MRRSLGAFLALLILLPACGGSEEPEAVPATSPPHALQVVAASYPLEFIATTLVGDKAKVTSLASRGVQPHDLGLTPGQVEAVRSADLLIYLGRGFQPAVEALVPEVAGRTIDGLEVADQEGKDPHVWLDPVLMAKIATKVSVTLGEMDHRNLATYVDNLEKLLEDLQSLDDTYQKGLALCDRRELVTSHEAFGHLARRYNLEQIGIAGIDPDREPSARRLQEVTDLVKRKAVTTIFFEQLLAPDIAETVAREAGVETARLNTIETQPEVGDYLSAMKSNLSALREALGCR